jgi:hypothetical protein
MDSTNRNSKPTTPKSTNELIDELISELAIASTQLDDRKYQIAIQDALQMKGLPINKDNVEAIEALVAERLEPKVDTHYKHGDIWHNDPEVNWIWDGWIAEGYFHTLIAMQKVGKSTFLLNLIAELIQRTPAFLNFSLFSEKKYGFVLVGPDMNRRLWGKYGKLAGLLQEDDKGQLRWQEQIKYVFAEEDEIGIDKDNIKRLVGIAEELKAQGLHPIFVMDSYRALLSASGIEIEENSSRYANPLRQLKKALGKTDSTVILLHHSSQTSSKRAVAESNAGNASFNSVPDQILSLKWLADAGPDGARRDRRIVLSASGRTGRVMPDQLLEQSPDWGWSSYGETGDALLKQNALNERDRLAGDDAIAYDLVNTRTGNGQPSTSNDIRELRETTSQGRGNWGTTKINRLLKKLERKGLVIQDGQKAEIGDLGGRPSFLWWTFEREVIQPPEFASEADQFADLTGLNTIYCAVGETMAEIQPDPETTPEEIKRIVPCFPIGAIVTVKGGGVGKWKVIGANLASGMHVLESANTGLQKRDLRMIDLERFIDPDEEL